VDGHLSKPIAERSGRRRSDPPPAETTAAAKREQTPLSGYEKKAGRGCPPPFGSNVAKFAPHSDAVAEKVDGVKDAPASSRAPRQTIHIDPKSRCRAASLTRNVAAGDLGKTKILARTTSG